MFIFTSKVGPNRIVPTKQEKFNISSSKSKMLVFVENRAESLARMPAVEGRQLMSMAGSSALFNASEAPENPMSQLIVAFLFHDQVYLHFKAMVRIGQSCNYEIAKLKSGAPMWSKRINSKITIAS